MDNFYLETVELDWRTKKKGESLGLPFFSLKYDLR